MLALIQRVSYATIAVNSQTIANIKTGILALVGIEKTDNEKTTDKLLEKILYYRIFSDSEGKMNLNIKEVSGELLLVSQFTLVADTQSGTRPGFSTAMPPTESKKLYDYMLQRAKLLYPATQSGKFGAHMQISSCNDGPVSFILRAT